MVEVILALSVVIGFFLSLGVGVNTLGSTVGIVRGGTNINYITALLWTTAAAIGGVVLLSGRIVDTMSQNLIKLDTTGMFSVLFTVAIIATALALRGIPISTTYCVIGALAGYGFVAAANALNAPLLSEVLLGILASPFIALASGFIVFNLIKWSLKKEFKSIHKIESFEMKFFVPSFIAMLILAFALGANSIGAIIGLFGGAFDFATIALIGCTGLVIGTVFFGKRTSQRIGIELTDLSPSRGFAVMLVTGAIMIAFACFGLPISTTQTLLGSIIGVSLATRELNLKAARVSFSWLILLPAAALIISALIAGGIRFAIS